MSNKFIVYYLKKKIRKQVLKTEPNKHNPLSQICQKSELLENLPRKLISVPDHVNDVMEQLLIIFDLEISTTNNLFTKKKNTTNNFKVAKKRRSAENFCRVQNAMTKKKPNPFIRQVKTA